MNEINITMILDECPRCGAWPIPGCVNYGHHFVDSMAFNVECDECGLKTSWYQTPQEAVDAWNEIKEDDYED